MLCYAIHDWEALFARCWAHLAPGGWLELQDIVMPVRCADPSVSIETSVLLRATTKMQDVLRERGAKSVDTAAGERFVHMLGEQGFANVRREGIQWAYGEWPKGEMEKKIGHVGNFRETISQ